MNKLNELQKFHLYLWFNKATDNQKKKLQDYYEGVITSDVTDKISTMTYHELYHVVKYEGFDRPISEFNFEELLEQYIDRGLEDSGMIKNIATIFSSIEYVKLLEEFEQWKMGEYLPPLPQIRWQVEVLLPNFCTLVINPPTKTDRYTVFIGHGFMTEPTTLREVERKFRVFLEALDEYGTSAELTMTQVESLYKALSY